MDFLRLEIGLLRTKQYALCAKQAHETQVDGMLISRLLALDPQPSTLLSLLPQELHPRKQRKGKHSG